MFSSYELRSRVGCYDNYVIDNLFNFMIPKIIKSSRMRVSVMVHSLDKVAEDS